MKKVKAMVLSMVKLREAQLTAKIASAFSLIIQIILSALTEILFPKKNMKTTSSFSSIVHQLILPALIETPFSKKKKKVVSVPLYSKSAPNLHQSHKIESTLYYTRSSSESSPSCLPKTLSKHGVLSKRWSCIWTYVPCLSLDNDYFQYTDDVASAIDNTLILQRAPKLTKFFVRFHYEPDLKPRLDLWLHFATTAKVNQLSLHLTVAIDFSISDAYFNAYLLPQHLYTNEFVSELFFCFCKIKPKGLVRWSSLTCLVIKLTTLCEDAIRKVLMGCPKL